MGNPLGRVGLAAASLAVAALGVSTAAYAADAAPVIFGTFWPTRYDAKIQIVGGQAGATKRIAHQTNSPEHLSFCRG